MDAFLEDGSHEATIAVVRALVVAVPHTTDRLRDYILNPFFLINYCGFTYSEYYRPWYSFYMFHLFLVLDFFQFSP